jgi:glycosyltransferase involved in cell wall biosynthesis
MLTGGMETPTPSIGVVIPVYNEERWVAEAVESVLGQTSPADEVIVVDDGSTDASLERLAPYAGRVRVVRQENRGCGGAFNTGFRAATSEFVALCPADDLWEPRKLEWQREILAADPGIDVVFGAATYFGLLEGPFPARARPGRQDRSFVSLMYERNVIPDPSAVVRRELHERLGGYEERLVGEDYDFWMRALRAGATFFFDPRPVVRLRMHGDNLSLRQLAICETCARVHRENADQIADRRLVARVLAADLRDLGFAKLRAGELAEARRAYMQSLRYRPSARALAAALGLGLPLVRDAIASRASA